MIANIFDFVNEDDIIVIFIVKLQYKYRCIL